MNKPFAKAAGADPSWCNSTNKQNPPIQQNDHYFWTKTKQIVALCDLESLKDVNIVYFMTGSTIFNHLGVTAPLKYFSQRMTDLLSVSV